MILPHLQKYLFTPTSFILLALLQITACSSDNRINTVTDDIEKNNQTINEKTTNNTVIFSGIDNGNIVEDNDPNNNNLLEVSGKLNITGASGHTNFIANTITGNYGNLAINAAGNWNYAAKNTQAVIQNLAGSETLTDTLTVSGINGATHDITITIIGVDESVTTTKSITTTNITLSWIAPAEREDNSPLSLSAIAGYNIYYGTTPGQYPNSTSINDGSATGYVFNNFISATYYFVVTTIDTDGRESLYSTEIIRSI